MNRKLIRPTLADVKNRDPQPLPERPERHREAGGSSRGDGGMSRGGSSGGSGGGSSHQSRPPQHAGGGGGASAAAQGRKRIPPAETNAEIFYYKKQMDAHTPMVLVLLDGEEIVGTIEWYDRAALKINRRDAPNILLLKHQIKYMFKAEDRDGSGSNSSDDDQGDESDQS